MSQLESIASRNTRQAITDRDTNPHALSRITGIGYGTLNRKLDSGSFTLEQLERVAEALGLNPVDLLKDAA